MIVPRAMALALALVLVGCRAKQVAPKVASEDAASPPATVDDAGASEAGASLAAPDGGGPPLVLEPEAKTSHVPIVGCAVGDDLFSSCCTEKGYAAVEKMAKNRTAEECEKLRHIRGYSECPAFFKRGFNAEVQACMAGAMSRTLDRRLFALKRVDPVQFKAEMTLQRIFNENIVTFCDRNGPHEPSTGSFQRTSDCFFDLHAYRERQAAKINAGALTLGTGAPKRKSTRVLAPFAAALCKMPASVWEGGAVPADCEARVGAELERAVHDPDAPDD